MDRSSPDSSFQGIFQARILEWVAVSFSRRASRPRDWTQVSRTVSRRFTVVESAAQMGWLSWELGSSWGNWPTWEDLPELRNKGGLWGVLWKGRPAPQTVWSTRALQRKETQLSIRGFVVVQSPSCSWLLVTHGLQHTRPPCLPLFPRVGSNSCPSSRWCHPAISSSVVPYPQSLPASGLFPMSQLFTWGGQNCHV